MEYSNAFKVCNASPAAKAEVIERDGGKCILCGDEENICIEWFIPQTRLGLGIPQNMACFCHRCKFTRDNKRFQQLINNAFKGYLKVYYNDWDETKIVYEKEF